MQKAVRALVFLLLALFFRHGYVSSASVPNILIVNTQKSAETEEILMGFFNAHKDRFFMDEVDMEGAPALGSRRVSEALQNRSYRILFTIGAPATQVGIEKNPGIPLFYSMVVNPENTFSAKSPPPGIVFRIPIKTQLETMQKILPGMKRVGAVLNPQRSAHLITELKQSCEILGLEPVWIPFQKQQEIPEYLETLYYKRVDLLLVLPDNTFLNKYSLQGILQDTLQKKIPTLVYSKNLVQSGFLLGIYPDLFQMGKQAATVISEHLLDQKPLPEIAFPVACKFSINSKTMEILKIRVPKDILRGAELI